MSPSTRSQDLPPSTRGLLDQVQPPLPSPSSAPSSYSCSSSYSQNSTPAKLQAPILPAPTRSSFKLLLQPSSCSNSNPSPNSSTRSSYSSDWLCVLSLPRILHYGLRIAGLSPPEETCNPGDPMFGMMDAMLAQVGQHGLLCRRSRK